MLLHALVREIVWRSRGDGMFSPRTLDCSHLSVDRPPPLSNPTSQGVIAMRTFEAKMSSAAIVPAFIKQLQYCKLKPSETVIFLTDDASPREVVEAGFAACASLGSVSYEVHVPNGPDVR